jgi:hypothetical protein
MFMRCNDEDMFTQRAAPMPASDDATMAASQSSTEGPPPPENVRLDPTYTQTPFTVRITWDAPAWTDVLIYRGTSSTIEAVVGYDANLDPHYRYTLNNLQQNTTYSFRFQSQKDGVRGLISGLFSFTTQSTNDAAPPTDPNNFTMTCDPYTIYLRWTASTDNYDPANEIQYDIYNAATGVVVKTAKGTNHLEVTNGSYGFTLGEEYFVKARDRSGNVSTPSNSVVLPLSCKI